MKSLYFHSLPLLHFPRFCTLLPRPPLTFASHPFQWHLLPLPVAVTTVRWLDLCFQVCYRQWGPKLLTGCSRPLENRCHFSVWSSRSPSLYVRPNVRWDSLLVTCIFCLIPIQFSSPFSCQASLLIPSTRLALWCPVSTVKKLSNMGHPNTFLTHFPGNLGWSPGTLFSSLASLVLSSLSSTTPLKPLLFKLRCLVSPLPSVMNPRMLLCTHWGLWHLEFSHTPAVLPGELSGLPTDLSCSHIVPLSSLLPWLFHPLYNMTWPPCSFLESRTLFPSLTAAFNFSISTAL